jgi:hypothetical protein
VQNTLSRTLVPRLHEAVRETLTYARVADYAGFDLYDVWAVWPWREFLPVPATLARRVGRAAALRILDRYPAATRRLARVPKRRLPDAIAHFADALLYAGEVEEADLLLRWLEDNRAGNAFAWGLGYDYPHDVRLTAATPASTPTLNAYRAFAHRAALPGGEHSVDICAAIAREFLALPRLPTTEGICFPYAPNDRHHIHNANLAAAEILSDASARAGINEGFDLAEAALRYWLADWHRGAGFEYLGPEDRPGTRSKVDQVHSAMVVRSLVALSIRHSSAADVLAEVREAWLRRLSDSSLPLAPGDRGWVDGRACAEYLLLYLAFADTDRLDRLLRVVLDDFLEDGSLGYKLRRNDGKVSRMVYLRWVHAPLTGALAHVAATLA